VTALERTTACRSDITAITLGVRVLGTFRVDGEGGADRTPHAKKSRALFAYLTLRAGEKVDRTLLADLLWSDRPAAQALGSLRQALRDVRNALGPDADVLVADRTGVSVAARIRLDLHQISTGAVCELGALLAGLDGCDPRFDAWLVGERARVQARVLGLLRHPLEDTASRAAAILQVDPSSVDAHATLIRAHALRGDARAAVEQVRAHLSLQRDPLPAESPIVRPSLGGRRGQRARVMLVVGACPSADTAAIAGRLVDSIRLRLVRTRWLDVVAESDASGRGAWRYDVRVRVTDDGDSVPWTYEIVDLRSGRIVWSESLRGPRGNLESDESTLRAASTIEDTLRGELARRTSSRPEAALDADALVQRAYHHFHRMTTPDLVMAERLLRRAIGLEPDNGHAHSHYAFTALFRAGQDGAVDQRSLGELARGHARLAVELAPDDSWAWAVHGYIEAHRFAAPDYGLECLERAVRTQPHSAVAHALAATVSTYFGEAGDATRHADRAESLNTSLETVYLTRTPGAVAASLGGRHAEAVRRAKLVVAYRPTFLAPYVPLLSSLGHLGARGEAERYVTELRTFLPDVSVEQLELLYPQIRRFDGYRAGLLQAGLPARARLRK
jgi:DNA-binding SARP family transcriptional activator